MKISDILKIDHIFLYPSITGTDELYEKFTLDLKNLKLIENEALVKRLFIKRESLQSTAIGKGAATPHIYSSEFKKFFLALVISKSGIHYITPDRAPVHVVFLIMSDEQYVSKHLKTLSFIARLVDRTGIINNLKNLNDKQMIYEALIQQGEKIH